MTVEGISPVTAIVALLWAVAVVGAVVSLRSGLDFRCHVLDALLVPRPAFAPPATIILPCCGVDAELAATVAALGRQRYPDYDVIFTFESKDDPAFAAVGEWTAHWTRPRHTRVVAGWADACSQKVQNLLAAVAKLSPDRQVLAFLDSDAIPHEEWLANLVAPLNDDRIGATTGFRWYSAAGNWVEFIRSAWNAASLSYMHDPRLNFCWGGSMAVRRETFDHCRVASRWSAGLSDDYIMTRAMRDAGLTIRFVPQCLIPCHEPTGLAAFLRFARRQLIITRICAPRLWRAGLGLATNFTSGASATFFYSLYCLWEGWYALGVISASMWLGLLWLAKAKCLVRQSAVARILKPPHWTRRDWAADVIGSELMGMVHLGLLLSSARTRRIVWRSTVYEMVSPEVTRIIHRGDVAPAA